MIELTVKTLDAQNHHFTVPNDYTVEQLKEHIAETIQIPSESQRCIYLGQVLQNEMKLTDCDVHGKVIHVVHRPPPSNAYGNNDTPNANNSNNTTGIGPTPGRRFEHAGTMYLGAMAFPSDIMDGGLTFLQPRTNFSVSRLVVARNLLRRAVTIINRLEYENYFSSNQEPANRSQSRSATNNLVEDMNGATVNGTGLEQSDVEIRIELPNAQHDPVAETVVETDNGDEIRDPILPNGIASVNQPPAYDNSTEGTNNPTENDSTAPNGTNREDSNRRRVSRTPLMATVMGAVLHAQVRLIPFMRLLRQYLLQDTAFGPDMQTTHTEQQVQSLYNSVSELMHYFAHIYHSLSDIMCDFSQPPPRTLHCRPVILQQQHATVIRGAPRGHIVRSPLVVVSRNASNATSTETEVNGNATGGSPETASIENGEMDRHAGTPTVEVVIEEADTTNMQDGHEEVITESMDVSEPIGIEIPLDGSNNSEPNVTVREQTGNTYVIQSMPDRLMPEGIRINSMEATILTPNDDMAAALNAGTNQRWRTGIVPAEVLQNMFGLINQIRHTQRTMRSGSGTADRPRQTNAATNNTAENSTTTNNTTTGNGDNNQSESNTSERSVELDITALSRTFDPFLPCHSHHVHPIVSRVSGLRGTRATTTRNTNNTSSNQSAESSQGQQNSSHIATAEPRQPRESQAEPTAEEQRPAGQQSGRRNEEEGAFNIPELPRNLSNLFSNIFPGFSTGNVTVRRGSVDTNNTNSEADGRQPSTRARIQLSSNINALFPGAIHIGIDPITSSIVREPRPNPHSNQTDSNVNGRRRRTAARRSRPFLRMPDGTVHERRRRRMPNLSHSPDPSSESTSPSSISSSDEENVVRPSKTEKKDDFDDVDPSFTVKNLLAMLRKENLRFSSKLEETIRKESTSNFPLYVENQEASFLDVINTVVSNTSFKELITGGETNMRQLTSSIRQRIENFLSERRNIISDNENGLLNAVNILINNDLYRMKSLFDSDCIKKEIDLVSTICKFNQDSVPELIGYVTPGDLNDKGLEKLCKSFRFYVARLLMLFVHCISGDDKTIQIRKVLGAVIDEIIKNMPKDEDLERWLRNDFINHVITFSKISRPDNLPRFMRHYVVYRLPPVMPVQCTIATATITNIGEDDIANQQSQPMEVEDTVQSSSSSESSYVSANSDVTQNASEQTANTSVANSVNTQPTPISVTADAEQLPEVVLNSGEWHQTFPSEWVPIITRDIHRLRRQGSQPPFSDAYLSGMPTKRRKLVKKSKPDLQDSSQLITDNISTSVNAVGISADVNNITNHVTETNTSEGNLTEIMKEELKENVRENIVQQSEFLPHRFPDSTKYFMDK